MARSPTADAPLARSLPELAAELVDAACAIDPDTGEVPADASAKLDALSVSIADKAAAYSIADAQLRADEDTCRRLAAQLTDRARARAYARMRLNERMHRVLALLGRPINASTVTAYLHPQRSVELLPGVAVPDDCCMVRVERKPDLRAIKAALERGEQLPFARLVTEYHVRYR